MTTTMKLRLSALCTALLALTPALALADDAAGAAADADADTGAGAAPYIDFRDLPELPTVVFEDAAARVAVVAARRAEEDIVVGAAKREQSLGNVASAVTVISADRLRRFGYRTVSEALRAVAGLFVVDDRQTPRLGIRGVQILGDFNTRILVLVDGATVNEPWNQFVGISHDLPISIDEVARLEIIRGPVSSVYGTNAFFGIINIITRSADTGARAWGRATGSSFKGGGVAAGFATGDVNRQVRGSVSGTNRGGETLSIDGFEQSGNDAETSSDGMVAYAGAVTAQWGGLFAQVRAYQRQRELPGAPFEVNTGDDRNRNTDRQVLIEAGYTRAFGKKTTATVRAYFSRYQFKDFLVYEDAADPTLLNHQDIGNSTWFGAEARGRFEVLEKNRLGITLGGEITRDMVTSKAFDDGGDPADTIDIPTNFTVAGVYTEADSTISKWISLTGGLRFDNNTAFQSALSPRAALFIHPRPKQDDVGVKLLFARGFRNPSPYEAFFEDGRDLVKNDDLKPETIDSYEAVLWGRPRPGLSLRLSGYHWRLKDLIESVDVDIDPDPAIEELRLQSQNIAELQTTGAEVEAFYRNTRGWVGFAQATYAYVHRKGDSGQAVNAPEVSAGGGLSSPAFRGVHLSTEVVFLTGRRTREDAKTDPWLGWNTTLYMPRWRGLDATIGVKNMLALREQVPTQDDYDRSDAAGNPVPVPTLPGEGFEAYARVGYSY